MRLFLRKTFYCSLGMGLLALAGSASAIGLGELRGQPSLGEALRVDIELLGGDKQLPDASCFRLIQPAGGSDIPFLRRAAFSVRRGVQPVVELRSEIPLREPVLQIGLYLGCGHEVSREYMLLLSPANPKALQPEAPIGVREKPSLGQVPAVRSEVPPAIVPREAPPPKPKFLPRLQLPRAQAEVVLPDRLVLSGGGDVAEPSLRLATTLDSAGSGRRWEEAQREILRLEFRMLMALQEQATTQLATAEKLRNMESTLGDLKQRAAEFAQRVEDGKPLANAPVVPPQANSAIPDKPPVAPLEQVQPKAQGSSVSEWSFYAALLGAVLGLAGWLGWRHWQGGRNALAAQEVFEPPVPEVRVDPQRVDEHEELGGVDLAVEPTAMGMPMQVDIDLHAPEVASESAEPVKKRPAGHDSMMSIAATSLDEHFEVNPVMELADIMLSFGRVKGAAQALQEYIDHNPQEALQPWIRLMEVYRMAGMRQEFEQVARNLNQNFNVEVQQWSGDGQAAAEDATDGGVEISLVMPKPESLEDMPRLMSSVVDMWNDGDVVGYLYQLLRDNRGGQRIGFALPVVEDILFLIELKETANRME